MKQGWEIKKLGEVCDIICGQDYKSVKDDNGKYPIYGTGGIMGYASQYRCPANSVIIGRKGSINNPLFVETEFWNVDTAFGVVPNEKILHPKFFYLFCKDYDFTRHDVSVTIPSLRRTDILKINVPVPPIAEQEKIVAELDCLSGIIEKKKQQLKELDNLAQSIFYEMFGDPDNSRFPKLPLQNLSEYKLSYGSGASAVEFDKDVRYVRITDIQEDGKLDSNAMSPSVYEEKYLLHDGDILFARSGATVGKTYHYRNTDGKAIYAGYLIRFIPNQKLVLPEYVFYYTRSDYYHAFIRKSAQAVAQPNINAKQYGDLIVCVPPIALQQDFASKIEAIEKQKELIAKSIKETETLFNSRMDYYFN